ncbi:hypothetical protein BpHYR1_031461 [Brachionus plicatilis]|uniref:Uncharacterized protein n=1 Tax=Brachionus plicatilis TaxID=10195 RepID=A0A3M7R545_BRAPC|nr:hypothetical protein BpHYR1_031461 [Brachionus plicatilis]
MSIISGQIFRIKLFIWPGPDVASLFSFSKGKINSLGQIGSFKSCGQSNYLMCERALGFFFKIIKK